LQRADAPLQHQAQQCGLDCGRSGGELVEEQQAFAGSHQPDRPVGRGERHALPGGIVADDGQPREVGGFVNARDDGGQRQVEGLGELGERGGLADAGLAPQQHGQVRRDGKGERFQLLVGSRFRRAVGQHGQQLIGHVELGQGTVGGREHGDHLGRSGVGAWDARQVGQRPMP
jgi:hypothetical protein